MNWRNNVYERFKYDIKLLKIVLCHIFMKLYNFIFVIKLMIP
jgi:hypothetical protein